MPQHNYELLNVMHVEKHSLTLEIERVNAQTSNLHSIKIYIFFPYLKNSI